MPYQAPVLHWSNFLWFGREPQFMDTCMKYQDLGIEFRDSNLQKDVAAGFDRQLLDRRHVIAELRER